MAAHIFAASIGVNSGNVFCEHRTGTDVAGAEFVCAVQQEKDGAYAIFSSEPDGTFNVTVDARPWFEDGAEESAKTAEPFGLYIEAITEDGDTQNDWLTHLPQDRQAEAKAIGDLIYGTFGAHNSTSQPLEDYIFETIDTGDATNAYLRDLPLGGQAAAQVAGEFAASLDWMG